MCKWTHAVQTMLFKGQLYFMKPVSENITIRFWIFFPFIEGNHMWVIQQCDFWSSQGTFLKIIKILIIGRGETSL